MKLVQVETGMRRDERIELTRGLAAGSTVVARGAGFLHDSDVVRVEPDTARPRALAERK